MRNKRLAAIMAMVLVLVMAMSPMAYAVTFSNTLTATFKVGDLVSVDTERFFPESSLPGVTIEEANGLATLKINTSAEGFSEISQNPDPVDANLTYIYQGIRVRMPEGANSIAVKTIYEDSTKNTYTAITPLSEYKYKFSEGSVIAGAVSYYAVGYKDGNGLNVGFGTNKTWEKYYYWYDINGNLLQIDKLGINRIYEQQQTDVAEVVNYVGLLDALNNADIKIININGNIAATSPISVDNPVTINGNGNTLSFTSLKDITTPINDGLIINSNSVVNNLIVEGGLGVDKDNWYGSYAIQVYNTTATLNDITATGGNGGILVNGSTVTLTGTTNVTGNGYGGIEVSNGSGLDNATLNINTATIINDSEGFGLPTIWKDGLGSITVNGAESLLSYIFPKSVLKSQEHYYLNESSLNVTLVELNWGLEENAEITIETDATVEEHITLTLNQRIENIDALLVVEVSKDGILADDVSLVEKYAHTTFSNITEGNIAKFTSSGIRIDSKNPSVYDLVFTFNKSGTYNVKAYLIPQN